MEFGLFTMPSHPPERSLGDGHRWDETWRHSLRRRAEEVLPRVKHLKPKAT